MAEASEQPEAKKKGVLIPLLAGLVLSCVAGAGGFFAVGAGLLPAKSAEKPSASQLPKASFVPLEPLVISLGGGVSARHLRFRAQLEVTPGNEKDVIEVLPRVADVLNGYLRAVELADIEDPAVLVRLRAQMLRRVQIVVGDGLVSDLLVMEFVLS